MKALLTCVGKLLDKQRPNAHLLLQLADRLLEFVSDSSASKLYFFANRYQRLGATLSQTKTREAVHLLSSVSSIFGTTPELTCLDHLDGLPNVQKHRARDFQSWHRRELEKINANEECFMSNTSGCSENRRSRLHNTLYKIIVS